MAILQPATLITYTLQTEVASRVLLINRDVVDNGNGSVSVNFSASIIPQSTTFTLDSNNNETGVYETSQLPTIPLSPIQLGEFFTIACTLADGTVIALGELVSNFADQIIQQSTGFTGTTNTQSVNIVNVLAAQQAAATAAAQTTTTLTVSGSVEIAGATVSDGTNAVISDASGNYTLTEPNNWSGTITPTLVNYSFTPSSISYNNLTINQIGQTYTPIAS